MQFVFWVHKRQLIMLIDIGVGMVFFAEWRRKVLILIYEGWEKKSLYLDSHSEYKIAHQHDWYILWIELNSVVVIKWILTNQ